jgi:hypothetical protein
MKKGAIYFLLMLAFAFNTFKVSAQTGIGTTTPNASAKLEVASSSQGFLPPRIALTGTNDNTTIKNAAGTSITPATGLLVYNTATTGTAPNNVVPGYYFFNGTVWVQISAGLIIDNSKTAGFTLGAIDNNKVFLITSASNITVTVPNTLPIGFTCQIIQGGAGTITLAGSGVTLNSSNGLTTRATNSVVGLVMNTTTTGFIMGDSIF